MMENVLELIRERRSVRSFDGSELSAAEKRALRSFSDSIAGEMFLASL